MQLHARWQLSQPQAIKVSVVPMSLFKSMMLIKCHSLVSSSHTNLTDPTQIMTDLWNSLISAGEESLIEGSSSFLMFVLTEEYLTLLVMVVATYTSIKSTSCWRRCWKKRWVQNVTWPWRAGCWTHPVFVAGVSSLVLCPSSHYGSYL